jgi:hypothetical protein
LPGRGAPEQVALMRALRANQQQTDRFFGVIYGAVPPGDLFSPSNLFKILGPLGMAGMVLRG